jgi:serine/threonine-protein kinase
MGQGRSVEYQVLSPLASSEGSRAFLGLRIGGAGRAEPVALVWVPENLTDDAKALSRLRDDTLLAATLVHPSVTRVHELATVEEGVARVVEFVDGEPLRRILQHCGALPPRIAARIVCDVAAGVHYAHLAGRDDGSPLVHGDLRPETVLVGFDGAAKVAGYGALAVAPKEQQGNRVIGRRLYCAPEQAIGGRGAATPQTDVYLLALLMHECVTGRRPFDDVADVHSAVLERSLPSLAPQGLPAAVDDVLHKATARKVPHRHASVAELAEALERACGLAPRAEVAAFVTARLLDAAPNGERSPGAVRRLAIEEALAELETPAEPAIAARPQPAPKPRPRRNAVDDWARRQLAQEEVEEDLRATRRERNMRTGKIAAIAAAGLLGGWWLLPGSNHKEPLAIAPAAAPAPVVPLAPLASPAAPRPAAAPARPSLSLVVEPPVEAVIDGIPRGRTPLTVELSAGSHALELRGKGISVKRTIDVGASGTTARRLRIEKGYLKLKAPRGTAVELDGTRLARMTGELALFEGAHEVAVGGKAKRVQAFTLKAGQHLSLDLKPSRMARRPAVARDEAEPAPAAAPGDRPVEAPLSDLYSRDAPPPVRGVEDAPPPSPAPEPTAAAEGGSEAE